MGKNKKHKNDKSIVNRPQAATTDIAGKADTTTSFSDNIISSDPDKVKAHELAKNDNPASETITTSITDEVRAAAVSPDMDSAISDEDVSVSDFSDTETSSAIDTAQDKAFAFIGDATDTADITAGIDPDADEASGANTDVVFHEEAADADDTLKANADTVLDGETAFTADEMSQTNTDTVLDSEAADAGETSKANADTVLDGETAFTADETSETNTDAVLDGETADTDETSGATEVTASAAAVINDAAAADADSEIKADQEALVGDGAATTADKAITDQAKDDQEKNDQAKDEQKKDDRSETAKDKPKRKPSRDEELSKKSSKAVPLALLVILAALTAVYCGLAHYYKDHFLPGTTINEVNVSGMDASEAKTAIQADIRNYYLQVHERKGKDFINSEGLSLTFANPEDVDTLLESQDRWAWPLYFNKITDAELDLRWSVDEEALHKRVLEMNALKDENVVAPTDAYISDGGADTKVIVPETQGSQPDPDKLYSVIYEAVTNGVDEVDIDEAGCYITPKIYRDDKNLNDRLEQWNSYLRSVGLTYDYSDRKEVFDYATLCSLLIDDGEKVFINEEAVGALVQEWKQKYDTFGRSRQFRTHSGDTITVTGGDYGWVIKKASTVEEVINYINAGDNGTHTPPYSYKAKSRDTNDIGSTYVEISISRQRMWLYVNGECVVDTPVVTGNPNKGNSTLKGCYAIDAKKSPAVLKGQGYESHVVYWMPFNGNQGIHDADNWRSSYGGSIYLSNGSHGCVNTPRNKVKRIYQEVDIGTPVIVY